MPHVAGETLVLESFESAKLARQVRDRVFRQDGLDLLYWRNSEWLAWTPLGWRQVPDEWVEQRIWEVLEDAANVHRTRDDQGNEIETTTRLKPRLATVREARDILRGMCLLGKEITLPFAQRTLTGSRCDDLIVFEDVAIDVVQSARQQKYVEVEAGPNIVTLVRLRVKWADVQTAECPHWNAYMKASLPDVRDRELRERYYGDCLKKRKRTKRLLLEFGQGRSGKGTGARVAYKLVGGAPAYFGCKYEKLSSEFGAQNMEEAYFTVVSEVTDLDSKEGELLVGMTKTVLGDDPVQAQAKFKGQWQVIYSCGMVWQGQVIPKLPDDKGGLSMKILAIQYDKSFLNREDEDLEERLEGELPGIAKRLLDAAIRKEAAPADQKFVMSEKGKSVVDELRREGNPADAFLEFWFKRDENGVTEVGEIRKRRMAWEQQIGRSICNKDGTEVTDQSFINYLIRQSSWKLAKKRDGKSRRHLLGGVRLKSKAGHD